MAKLNVEILTPEKKLLSTQADEAVVPGGEGLFGVRPGHTPFLSLVEPGVLTLKDGTATQAFFVAGGFVEVGNDTVRVLADQAEAISTIDVAGAQRRLSEAQGRMKGLPTSDASFDVEVATVRRETARIAAAGK